MLHSKDGHYCSNPIKKNVSLESKSFSNDAIEAMFCLFIPEHVGVVEKVWLLVKDDPDKVQMTKVEEQKSFWTAVKKMSRSKQYHYTVQFKDSVVIRFLKAFVRMQKGNRYEEPDWRPLFGNFKQKDILLCDYENKDISVAYKYFFKLMLEDISTSDMLKCHIGEFESKHVQLLLQGCCNHEIACLLLECFTADHKHTFEKAIFLVYVLSKLYPDVRSIQFLPGRVSQTEITGLLKILQCHKLEFSDRMMESKAANIVIALAEKCFGSSCSLFHLVVYCYPTLSGSKIMEHKDSYKPISDSEKLMVRAVEHLCSLVDETEAFVQLLLETLKRSSFTALRPALKVLQTNLPPDSYLLKRVKDQMIVVFKWHIQYCTSCDDLYNIYEIVDDFDQKLVVELAEVLEKLILVHFNKGNLNKDQVLNMKLLIRCPDLFLGQDHIMRLIRMVVNSQHRGLHSLFPEILTDRKYLSVLGSQPLLGFIEAWIQSAKSIQSIFEFDQNWYESILKITESLLLVRNKELLVATEKMIYDYFSHGVIKWATSCKDVVHLLQNSGLLRTDSTQRAVFDAISPDLERMVIERAKTNNDCWGSREDPEALASVVTSHLLFTKRDNALKILEAIAKSKVSIVHGKLVDIMSNDKFWRQLNGDDLLDIFHKWFETARHIHSNCKATNHHPILCLYEYLATFLSLSVPTEHEIVKGKLEMDMKNELATLPVRTRLDLLKCANKKIFKLFEKHVQDLDNETLTGKDLDMYLTTYGERKMFQFEEW